MRSGAVLSISPRTTVRESIAEVDSNDVFVEPLVTFLQQPS